MSSEKIGELQLLQQNLQTVTAQKQQIEEQLTEFNSALNELTSTEQAYKIVGKIMIATSSEDLTKELNDKKEIAEVRLKNFVSQEEKLKTNIEKMQQEVMKELQEKKEE
jgi:prefoldin beta subunit